MQLHDLQPACGAALTELDKIFTGREWRTALPSALPEHLLLRLARDFRCVEQRFAENGIDSEPEGLASALCVVLGLLRAHPKRKGPDDAIQIAPEHLMQAFKVYQITLEREISTRILGVPIPQSAESMLAKLERLLSN